MDAAIVAAKAADVQALIARLILEQDAPAKIGTITLARHQMEAVSRIQRALEEFHGAFLCDAVGSGKTYIGLAVAARMRRPMVIAPAALREMWSAAISRADSKARLISIESLSRGPVEFRDCDGLIVDEAHHFRNRATKRYSALSRLARSRGVLLITATPIHNSIRDFKSLAAIFLGTRARHLSALDMTRLVIRRDTSQARINIPEILPTKWLDVGDDDRTVAGLVALPPALPLRDAGEAAMLMAHGLVRQWASSEAALDAALRRRRVQASALESALQAGEHPSAEEIRSWILGDDAIQLSLPELFAQAYSIDAAEMLRTVRRYSDAVDRLIHARGGARVLDEQRAALLGEIASEHAPSRIVAFASYEATVTALFRRLVRSHRVAYLTSRGARVAGGSISRADAIRQFDPSSTPSSPSERIDLLLTTDLLSEGVNLQQAAVVVHLDIPWTAARLEQRVGRLARLGSRASRISVYGIRPPHSAERALHAAALVQSKWSIAASAIGAASEPGLRQPDKNASRSLPEIHETLREVLRSWAGAGSAIGRVPVVAAVEASRAGFLAVVEDGSRHLLLCGKAGVSTEPGAVYSVARCVQGGDAEVEADACDAACIAIKSWLAARESKELAGVGDAAFLRDRRKVFARINSFAANIPPHARFSRKGSIERARTFATQTLGAEEERVLVTLDPSIDPLTNDECLDGVRRAEAEGAFQLRALLLLVAPLTQTI